jgi:hypothetical protein
MRVRGPVQSAPNAGRPRLTLASGRSTASVGTVVKAGLRLIGSGLYRRLPAGAVSVARREMIQLVSGDSIQGCERESMLLQAGMSISPSGRLAGFVTAKQER